MTQSTSKDQDRGPGAEKVELEKRLDANTEAEKKARVTSTEGKLKPSTDDK